MFKTNIAVHVYCLWVVVFKKGSVMDREEAAVGIAKDIRFKIVIWENLCWLLAMFTFQCFPYVSQDGFCAVGSVCVCVCVCVCKELQCSSCLLNASSLTLCSYFCNGYWFCKNIMNYIKTSYSHFESVPLLGEKLDPRILKTGVGLAWWPFVETSWIWWNGCTTAHCRLHQLLHCSVHRNHVTM
jgi:hypothetical protein